LSIASAILFTMFYSLVNGIPVKTSKLHNMANTSIVYDDFYYKWKTSNGSEDQIINDLRQNGMDSLQIIEILNFCKKKANDEKQNTGFLLTGIGAFIGFLSCVFTMLDLLPEFRGFMLYGLTSIALVFIFIGLYFIFE
jgi:hypothetical protein